MAHDVRVRSLYAHQNCFGAMTAKEAAMVPHTGPRPQLYLVARITSARSRPMHGDPRLLCVETTRNPDQPPRSQTVPLGGVPEVAVEEKGLRSVGDGFVFVPFIGIDKRSIEVSGGKHHNRKPMIGCLKLAWKGAWESDQHHTL